MGAISNWSANQPSGSSSLRDSDDQLRSHWSILEAAWKQEHYFSASSTGVHAPGSARVYTGARSALSVPTDGNGRIYVATDTGSLHLITASSSSTIVEGTAPYILAGPGLGGLLLQQNVSSGSWTLIAASKLTVGAGYAGRFYAHATALPTVNGSAASVVAIRILKGTNVLTSTVAPLLQLTVATSGMTSAAANDVFSLEYYHTYGSTISTSADRFTIERM